MSKKGQTPSNAKRNAKQGTWKSTARPLDPLVQQQSHPPTLIKRAQFDMHSLTPPDMLQLQRMIGNQAAGKLLSAASSLKAVAPLQRDSLPALAVQRTLEVDDTAVTDPGAVPVPPGVEVKVFRSAISKLIGSSTKFSLTTENLSQLGALLAGSPLTSMSVQALNAYAKIMVSENVTVGRNLQWTLKPENLRILGAFFQEHPGLAARVGIDFTANSAVDSGYGGGVYNRRGDKRIEIGSSVAGESDPLYFLQTVIHETGHATFQQMLIRAELSTETVNGTIMARLAEAEEKVRGLEWQLKKGLSSLVGNYDWVPDKEAELAKAQAERDRLANNLRLDKESLTEDGAAFYGAWQVLRQEGGRYMLGLALSDDRSHPTKSPEGRQHYMAGSFNEFCAESFMYMALNKGALYRHYRRRRDDPNIPDDVKQALATTFRILEKYETRILDTHPWAPSKPPENVKKLFLTTREKGKVTSQSN